jgi:TolB-like protein
LIEYKSGGVKTAAAYGGTDAFYKESNRMKKIFFALAVFLLISGCSSSPAANPDEVSLATAIREAAARMESGLDRGTKVALINFTSPSQAFSDYVLDELSSVLVNNRYLVVVDRANLDRIRQELGFNSSGEVSDRSMQEIGLMLGAQALVTGSLTSIADLQRVMFKVIMTETAAVAVQHPADIINDRRVQALLAQGGGSQGVAYGNANYGAPNSGSGNSNSGSGSGNTQAVPAQAQPTPAQPAGPQNGTYTFWPRPQATKAGMGVTCYLVKARVSGSFVTFFLTVVPTGQSRNFYGQDIFYWSGYDSRVTLQNLDNPARSWNPVRSGRTSGDEELNGNVFVTFENITGTRFKFSSSVQNPPSVFDEIILGEPDRE